MASAHDAPGAPVGVSTTDTGSTGRPANDCCGLRFFTRWDESDDGRAVFNSWYQAERRGSTGVFGAGMGGTALSAFFTPRFVTWFGYTLTHVIIAVALVAMAAICWFTMTNSPVWRPNSDPVVPQGHLLQPPLQLPAGTTFVRLSFTLGLGMGGVFAWVAEQSPPERVGSVTGIVGAAGGLGGFFPPLVMGATFGKVFPGYGFGLALLVLVAAGALAFTYLGIRPARRATSR